MSICIKDQIQNMNIVIGCTVGCAYSVDFSGINWIVVGTMTGVQSRKVHTEPEWAWSLTDQAHVLDIPVFMKEDLVPIIGNENIIQEMPEEFNKVLEVQRSWQK